MKNLRKGKKRAPRTEAVSATVSETHEDLLCRLPNELLLKIIEYLDDDSRKFEENFSKKIKQGINLESGEKTRLWLYQHNPECPIMSDIQSFSLVNRRIYAVCEPMIWEFLQFPSGLSCPMSFWIQEILPKHGHQVNWIDVALRYDWLHKPVHPLSIKKAARAKTKNRYSLRSSGVNKIKFIQEEKDYWEVDGIHLDNLNVVHRGIPGTTEDPLFNQSYGLGRENLVKVLSYCDNLTSLWLACPDHYFWARAPFTKVEGMRNLACNLDSLFSELGRLKSLVIRGPPQSFILAECFVEPIAHLSLLETLELAYISHEDREQVDKLGVCLSKFEHLKELSLNNVDVIESSWGCHQGPPQLKYLKILECKNLRVADTPGFISAWAPRLNQLEIKFIESSEPELSNFNTDDNQFLLPDLNYLTIWPHSECQFVNCFKDCKDLRQITFYQFFNDHELKNNLQAILDFLSLKTLPRLEMVTLLIDRDNFPLDLDEHRIRDSMDEFCKNQKIELNFIWEDVPNELPPEIPYFSS